MCGILGAYHSSISKQLFNACLDTLSHRGPDGRGVWDDTANGVLFGHRRLSIIDLSDDSRQPMVSGNGRFVITFNGEIFNYVELREELKKLGYEFRSSGDTEVLLAAYETWGEKCLRRLNGMWAFAIYDSVKKTVFLSRDRYGVKPLFFCKEGESFYFASEMKALIPMLKKVSINRRIVGNRFAISHYEHTQECVIQEIKRLPAGYNAIIEGEDISLARWWNTLDELEEPPKTYEEQVERFKDLFLDACRIRMRSDVKLGTALSGGIDSTATICSMAHIINSGADNTIHRDYQHAVVCKMPGTDLDESKYADIVTDYLGMKSDSVYVDPIQGLRNLPEMIYKFEEVYYTSPVPMMQTYRKMRDNGIYVSLDGHGADEMFGGYDTCVLYALLDEKLFSQEWDVLMDTYRAIYSNDAEISSGKFSGKKVYMRFYLNRMAKSLLGYGGDRIYEKDDRIINRSHCDRFLYNIFHVTILPTILRNFDRMSMANGVEIRMPFMDYRLVNYAFSLDWRSKIRNGYTKSIVRDGLKGIIPDEIATRKTKVGFGTPIVDWIRGPWKEFILDTVHSADFADSELVHAQRLKKEFTDIANGERIRFAQAADAWTRFMPYLWKKWFYDEALNLQERQAF